MKKFQNYVYEIRKIDFLFQIILVCHILSPCNIRCSTSYLKGEIRMEYQYEVEQRKEEFMHEDQWADSLIKWLFIFLIIVGIPYTAYVVVQFILSF